MIKKISTFDVNYTQIMDEKGDVDDKLMPKLSSKQIKDFYEWMIKLRAMDKKALSLQRQGRMGTYAQVKGMEALQVGTALALNKKDWMFPTFRESGAMIARGIPMSKIFLYWGGDERGSQFEKDQKTFPIAIPVCSQMTHATGCAWGMKIKDKKEASLVYFGDGATSRGDFHEALNFASVLKAPCVFICNNNQFAISTRPKDETASETFAQKAIAYGMEGVKIDGNDIFGVYKATQDALQKAYAGKGPTLIECFTYRVCNHTTSDDASKYRSKKEVDEWVKKDPIDRLRKYMEKKKLWTKDYEGKLYNKVQKLVEKEVEKMENIEERPVTDMFDYLYDTLDDDLKEQRNKYV